MAHWRTPRQGAKPCPVCRQMRVRATVALALAVAALLLARSLGEMVERREVVRQAPPYYQCLGPKETRHPRCDRD